MKLTEKGRERGDNVQKVEEKREKRLERLDNNRRDGGRSRRK